MTTVTMDEITAIIDNANMRLQCVAASTYEFAAADHCTVTHPILEIVDLNNEGEAVATIMAPSLARIIAAECFMDYVQSVCTAVGKAHVKGKLAGRLEAQAEMRRAMGVLS